MPEILNPIKVDEYLKRFDLQNEINLAVNAAVRAQTENPLDFIGRQLIAKSTPASPRPVEAPLASRVTMVPIKPGSKDQLLAIANSQATQDAFKTEPGFAELIEVAVMITEDDKMVARSLWTSLEAANGSDQAQMAVMGPMKEHFAGPPQRTTGVLDWVKAGTTKGPAVASRVTMVPIKPGSKDQLLAIANSEATDKAFKTEPGFAELIEVAVMITEDDKMVARSLWTSLEAANGSDQAQMAVMGPMKEHFAGPPQRTTGVLDWSYKSQA